MSQTAPPIIPSFSRREQVPVWAGLAITTVVAWFCLLHLPAATGQGMGMAAMGAQSELWGPQRIALTFAMWAVMMAAMMIPSAGPTVSVYALAARSQGNGAALRTALFVTGYVLVWTLFSAAATSAQWLLGRYALLSPAAALTPIAGAAVVGIAGLYQLTPLKRACLRRCRSPYGFVMTAWRPGERGALLMGAQYGAICTGCCWMLMAVLFAAGVMNLLWVAGISLLVLLEKVTAWGEFVARIGAAALIGWAVLIACGV